MSYDRVVRVLLVTAVLAGCTFGNQGPAPVTARPEPDPDRMPSAVLDRQDPGADTSNNPILSRTEAHYVDPNDTSPLGCLRRMTCSTGDGTSGVAISIVLYAVIRRRRRATV